MAQFLRRLAGYEQLSQNADENSYQLRVSPNGREANSSALRNEPLLTRRTILRGLSGLIAGITTAARTLPTAAFRRHRVRKIWRFLLLAVIFFPPSALLLALLTGILYPSYTHLPAHYQALGERCKSSDKVGCANARDEKVFISASLYEKNGELSSGPWGNAVVELVEMLGPDNVYVSIYENDVNPVTESKLRDFEQRLTCNNSIVTEHLPPSEIAHVSTPTHGAVLKRIAFLAEARNRGLRPLEGPKSKFAAARKLASTRFDRVLFLNDVSFNALDAAQLLFSTNVDDAGVAQYRGACAVDFINPFKFYDTFATRDLEGFGIGIPFFPWFSDAGQGVSRSDVLRQSDAVRVRSCWGGMAAYEAKWFQVTSDRSSPFTSKHEQPAATSLAPGASDMVSSGLRFRAEADTFWEASECCLINADLQYPRPSPGDPSAPSGIFMNPYIRVAYDQRTLSLLPFTRRPERLYSFIHNLLNHMVGKPGHGLRRLHEPGDEVEQVVWVPDAADSGAFQRLTRVPLPGGYCGSRKLLGLNEHPQEGQSRWMRVPIPGCRSDTGGCKIEV